MPATSVEILPIPTEIAEQVLSLCHPRDVAAFAQTCHAAWSLVNGSTDQHLWRQLFLLFPFDDPRKTHQGVRNGIPFDWKTELQRRMFAERVAHSSRLTSAEDLQAALSILLGVVQSAPPIVLGYEHVPSANLRWVMDILESTNMLQLPSITHRHTTQTLACLRTYLALTLDKYDDDEGRLRRKSMRTRSRHQVYDLDNYTRDNDWGPFMSGTGDVNWFHTECIVNVIALNFSDYSTNHSELEVTSPPRGLEATRAYSAPGATTISAHDWAGVEGNWRRIVSFMDHRDLFAFNFFIRGHFSHVHGGSFFEDLHFSDVTILMELKFQLISPDALPDHYILNRFPSKDANYPTLYFSGTFRNVEIPETAILGSVHLDDNGIVRWRFRSVHAGRVQWSSEGVQIGGIASAMGIVGIWTAAQHQREDPAGPFWLWKVREEE